MYTHIHRLTLLLALAYAIPALAADQRTGSLTITQPWSRATAPGAAIGTAYFEIVNAGAVDTLLRIESPIARQVEMHTSYTEAGIMRMRPVTSVDVPARGRVRFEPSGLHVMLIDLVRPLRKGDRLPLTLVFQRAGPVRVDAIVQDLGTLTPPGGKDTDNDHHP